MRRVVDGEQNDHDDGEDGSEHLCDPRDEERYDRRAGGHRLRTGEDPDKFVDVLRAPLLPAVA
jgi:hypothetical protein